MTRTITYHQALLEAVEHSMHEDPSVYIMGLGVPDPKGVFGTTANLQQTFGPDRVMDMPCSENGMTGIAIGTALTGMRPIMTHQRVDFAFMAIEEIVNQAANWHYMFGGKTQVPLVIRMIIGRGWGQGPQHSQNMQAWFSHIPGLKVIVPATPYDAKGLLRAAILDNGPVLSLEHRWLYNIEGPCPKEDFSVEIGKARVIREGHDVTLVASGYMTVEACRAADRLKTMGIHAEVVDMRSAKPIDMATVSQSVIKTGKLIAVDHAWKTGGFAGEIVASVCENNYEALTCAPKRITLPDCPTPTAPSLSEHYYPQETDIAAAAASMIGKPKLAIQLESMKPEGHLDIPDMSFTGPF